MRMNHFAKVAYSLLAVAVASNSTAHAEDSVRQSPFTLAGDASSAPVIGNALITADLSNLPGTDKPLYGCACGCGIFEVGTATMMPHGAGGMAFIEYDYQDQNTNWSGNRPSAGSNNPDKEIRTNFFTLGVQYFFNREWGIQLEIPYNNRAFKTTGGPTGSDIVSLQWGAFGDVRIQGYYTGLFDDQSLGITFGLKLPTGNWQHSDGYPDVDRDSELGTGCLDVLLGGFYRQHISDDVVGFAQLAIDAPVMECEGYRPGIEADLSLGAYYTPLHIGRVSIVPVGQILFGERGHDSGPNAAHPIASGYQRVLLSPGVEFDVHPFMVYADIEVPVWQHVSGNQLTAPFLVKVILSYNF